MKSVSRSCPLGLSPSGAEVRSRIGWPPDVGTPSGVDRVVGVTVVANAVETPIAGATMSPIPGRLMPCTTGIPRPHHPAGVETVGSLAFLARTFGARQGRLVGRVHDGDAILA